MEKPEHNKSTLSKWRMIDWAFELGFIIALPLLAFSFVGKWLDAKFGTDKWLTLAGMLVAIAITTIWLTRRIKEILKK